MSIITLADLLTRIRDRAVHVDGKLTTDESERFKAETLEAVNALARVVERWDEVAR